MATDHDHFCGACGAYWGCEDEYCHLPTEEFCPEDGGGVDSNLTEHIHECLHCDNRTGEYVDLYDWIHSQDNCRQPRCWPCEKHRGEGQAEIGTVSPENPTVESKEPFWWAAQVNSLIQRRKTGTALRTLNHLLTLNIDRHHVLLYKVRVLQARGRLKEAIAWVCLEAELHPEDPKVLALKDWLMELYPYSLFDARRPTPDLLAAFRRINTDWPDVAGMYEVKIQLHNDIVLPFRYPEKYQRFGIGLPNGILFHGPAGCGKTFLARKVAEKIAYNFHEVKISDVGSPYIHETALRLRGLFDEAEKNRPTILFFDEVDSLASSRSGPEARGHQIEEVNELLKLMDKCSERGILVIAACNSIERVDPAMLRPGRFDKRIYIGPPDEAARYDLFRLYLANRLHADSIELDSLVRRTDGYSNADIEEVVKEAAKNAASEDAPKITQRHLVKALEEIRSSLSAQPVDELPRRRPIGFSTDGH